MRVRRQGVSHEWTVVRSTGFLLKVMIAYVATKDLSSCGTFEGSAAWHGAASARANTNARLYALVAGPGAGTVVRHFSTLGRAEQALREHQLRRPGQPVRIVAPTSLAARMPGAQAA